MSGENSSQRRSAEDDFGGPVFEEGGHEEDNLEFVFEGDLQEENGESRISQEKKLKEQPQETSIPMKEETNNQFEMEGQTTGDQDDDGPNLYGEAQGEVMTDEEGNEEDQEEEEEDEDDDDEINVIVRQTPHKVYIRPGAPAPPKVGMFGTKGAPAAFAGPNNVPNIPNFKSAHDIELDDLEEKPWNKPGANIEDWFNYGFNEETWRDYERKQRQLRSEAKLQGQIPIFEASTNSQSSRNQQQNANNNNNNSNNNNNNSNNPNNGSNTNGVVPQKFPQNNGNMNNNPNNNPNNNNGNGPPQQPPKQPQVPPQQSNIPIIPPPNKEDQRMIGGMMPNRPPPTMPMPQQPPYMMGEFDYRPPGFGRGQMPYMAPMGPMVGGMNPMARGDMGRVPVHPHMARGMPPEPFHPEGDRRWFNNNRGGYPPMSMEDDAMVDLVRESGAPGPPNRNLGGMNENEPAIIELASHSRGHLQQQQLSQQMPHRSHIKNNSKSEEPGTPPEELTEISQQRHRESTKDQGKSQSRGGRDDRDKDRDRDRDRDRERDRNSRSDDGRGGRSSSTTTTTKIENDRRSSRTHDRNERDRRDRDGSRDNKRDKDKDSGRDKGSSGGIKEREESKERETSKDREKSGRERDNNKDRDKNISKERGGGREKEIDNKNIKRESKSSATSSESSDKSREKSTKKRPFSATNEQNEQSEEGNEGNQYYSTNEAVSNDDNDEKRKKIN